MKPHIGRSLPLAGGRTDRHTECAVFSSQGGTCSAGTAKVDWNAMSMSFEKATDSRHLSSSLEPEQVKVSIIVTTAAAFIEELTACLEDSKEEKALDDLSTICSKALTDIKPLTSCQTSKEKQYWLALSSLSQTLTRTPESLPNRSDLLEQILDPLQPANGYEGSAQFANGAHQASRIQFWEMIRSHIETIEAALQGCSASTQR